MIQLFNPRASEIFGYEQAELLGQKLEVLLPDNLRKHHVAHRDGYLDGPKPRAMGSGLDLRGKKKDGEEVPLEISLNPFE